MKYIKDHGGREKYTRCRFNKDNTGDCVIRAIAIATGKDYREVRDALFELAREMWVMPSTTDCYEAYLTSLGWERHSPLKDGNRKVLVKDFPIKTGAVIIHTCKHLTTIVDGEIHDTWDTSGSAANSYYTCFKSVEPELLPCPFCGGKALYAEITGDVWCGKCTCTIVCDPIDYSFAAWNRRAELRFH